MLQDNWVTNGPPAYIGIAALIGHKKPDKAKDNAGLAGLIQALGGGHG